MSAIDKPLTDNGTHDALHGAAERLERLLQSATNTRQRTALKTGARVLKLIGAGLIAASALEEDC